jgi:hypothetical protein
MEFKRIVFATKWARQNHTYRMKEGALIRHCEKTLEKKLFVLEEVQRGFRGNLLKRVHGRLIRAAMTGTRMRLLGASQ